MRLPYSQMNSNNVFTPLDLGAISDSMTLTHLSSNSLHQKCRQLELQERLKRVGLNQAKPRVRMYNLRFSFKQFSITRSHEGTLTTTRHGPGFSCCQGQQHSILVDTKACLYSSEDIFLTLRPTILIQSIMHGISSLSSITLAAFCCSRVFLIIIMMPRERLRSLSLAGLHRKTKQVLLDRYSRHFIDAILDRITRCQSEADSREEAMPFSYLQISSGITRSQVQLNLFILAWVCRNNTT